MSKRNELSVLVISLLATVAILGGGAWFLTNRIIETTKLQKPNNPLPTQPTGKLDTNEADGSAGVSVLPDAVSPSKQRGLDALADKDYATAQLAFEAALKEARNDPESLIYLNNAKIGRGKSYTIALIVPAEGVNVGAAKELMRGAAQAQAEINDADGIKQTPLKVIIVNDNDDADV
ncbi:MAG: ABC transporter substrate-binding protein, partial [Phormidesmis sp.]